jgi:Ca2+-binding RTX toxin-like protein
MRRPKFNSLRKFEVLEDRRMMAGISYDSNTDTITINGDGYDDVAEVRFEDEHVYIELIAKEGDGGSGDHEFEQEISDVSKIIFNGSVGKDILTVSVDDLDSGITLNYVLLEFHGGENEDQLINELQGGVRTLAFGDGGNDILQGGRYDDILEGGAGNDDLHGGAGNDKYVFSGTALGTDSILNEGANVGSDTLDLTNFGHPVFVDLAEVYNASSIQYAITESFIPEANSNLKLKLSDNTAIENVIGTAYQDFINGNSRPNFLSGRGGHDNITGAGGNDTLDGGAGSDSYHFAGSNLGTDSIIERANTDNDTLDFSGMLAGVTVDLTKFGTNYAVNSADLTLRLANDTAIENVYGSNYNDHFIGNSRDNGLWGLGGNDLITGGAGYDYVDGGDGDDRLVTDALDTVYGGLGKDRFDGFYEGTPNLLNPRPGRYMDWKVA